MTKRKRGKTKQKEHSHLCSAQHDHESPLLELLQQQLLPYCHCCCQPGFTACL
jgi:hypothetical protein